MDARSYLDPGLVYYKMKEKRMKERKEEKEKVKVSYLTRIVNESPKAYFQPSPLQMSLAPSLS